MKQLERLEMIAANLPDLPEVLGLIGVGSVGKERARLDEFSDLDFFLVVKAGEAKQFISDLSWLENDEFSVDFHFQDTPDGIKVIWSDGLYGEFAVFEEERLSTVVAAGAKIIWQREGIEFDLDFEKNIPKLHDADYYFNAALTNLYVAGLRHARGEILSANSFIFQALTNVMLGISLSKEAEGKFVDKFDKSRRFEQNFPEEAAELQAIFASLADFNSVVYELYAIIERYFSIHPALAKAVLK